MKKHPKGFASNSSLFSSLLGGGQGNSGNGGSRLHRVEENDRQTVGLSDKDRVGESILEDEEMHRDELGLSIATSEISLRTMPMINSVENDFSSSDNEDVDDEFTDLHEEEENLLYYRRDDHYGEEMSEDSSTGASTTRVNTNALVTPTNPILNYGTETSTTLKKKKKKKKKKKSDKAKLDLQFMIRFFKMVGYCLRDIGYNSDYHWTDENGRRVSRTFFRNRVMNELNENSKQEKKGCGTLCYNFSMFNAFLVLSFLFVCIGEILLGNEVGKLPGAFYTVIIDASAKNFGDAKPFIHVMLTSLLWICGITALKTFRQFVLDVIRVYWRRNLTYHTQRRYFENSNFYKMLLLDKRIDNPDQRITKDAENFVDTTCKLIESVFTGPITVFYYTVTVFLNLGWQGPLFCFVFFVIGSICNKLIISPIANLWFIQEKFEGNFRYTHALLRSNAESVAFYGGERNEKMKCNQKLKGAIKNRRKIVFWNLLLNGNMNLFGYVGSILAYVIVAISVFLIGGFIDANATAGEIAGKISVSSFQVMMLIYGFTTFIQTGSNISELAGFTGRLGEMHEVMNEIEKDTELNQVGKVSEEHSLLESTTSNSQHNFQQESDLSGSTDSNVNYIEFKNVSVSVPKGIREKYRTNHNLVENLSFKILPSQHTLIAGPSGCGKSSVLRILANLWPNNSGQIIKPSAIIGNSSKPNIFYVPQNPYISSGSLRDQITYPLKTAKRNIEDHPALLEAIQLSRLEYILDRVHKKDWDGDCNWNELLSPGEKQRLALARIFYHKPTFVILDEATSACDVNVEEMIYRDIIKQGSTVVSVGHRPTIVKFHTHMLRINASSSPTTLGNGKGWEFGEISDFRKKKNY